MVYSNYTQSIIDCFSANYIYSKIQNDEVSGGYFQGRQATDIGAGMLGTVVTGFIVINSEVVICPFLGLGSGIRRLGTVL